jgi:protein SCO1/2
MKYHELALVIAILSAGSVLAPGNSLANAVDDNQLHHHHHHAMAGNGYTRSVASYRTPDVKLTDADGREVSLHDSLEGKEPVMLNFIFTTCSTICPVMSASFSQAQEKFVPERGKVRMVSISIDPEHDTPARLKEYSKKFGAGPQWSMLTGSIENSIAVQRAFNVYRGDKMNHEPVTFIHMGAGQPWVRIDGFISADDLLSEYRKFASN